MPIVKIHVLDGRYDEAPAAATFPGRSRMAAPVKHPEDSLGSDFYQVIHEQVR